MNHQGKWHTRLRCNDCGSFAITTIYGAVPDDIAGDDPKILDYFRPQRHICGSCGSENIITFSTIVLPTEDPGLASWAEGEINLDDAAHHHDAEHYVMVTTNYPLSEPEMLTYIGDGTEPPPAERARRYGATLHFGSADLLRRVARGYGQVDKAFEKLRVAAEKGSDAVHKLARLLARYQAEKEQGYRYPNWVWETMEEQRRQFGSGNGRHVRK